MSDDRKVYLVCYDVANASRLRKVYKTCRSWGDHMQFSVFRCVLSARQLAAFRSELDLLIHHDEDQVLFVTLGGESSRSWSLATLGQPMIHPERVARVF